MSEETNLIKCANCELNYQENYEYCPHCGQKNENSILTFKEILSDLLGSFFSFDSKAFNSLPKLLFKPGRLTVDYLKGKRAANLSPFKMYLFFSVVLFLLLPLILKNDNLFADNEEGKIEERNNQDDIEVLVDSINIEFEQDSAVQFNTEESSTVSRFKVASDLVDKGFTYHDAIDSVYTDKSKSMKFTIQQGLKVKASKGRGLISVFLNSLSYSLFLFLPLFALLLKLFYVRRERFYIEHLIFSLHIFSFIFLVLILFTLLEIFNISIPFWIATSVILVYLYIAMLKVYQQSWIKTLVKNVGLLFTTTIFLVPFIFITAILVSFFFY